MTELDKSNRYKKESREYNEGTMSVSEWNSILDDYVGEDARKAGSITAVPTTWETEYSFPVNEHVVTKDYIRRYAFGIGDSNPLYRDAEYGHRSPYGTIIAPPIFQHAPAGSPLFPDKPAIPGLHSFYGGTENIMYKVYRPGDRLEITNKYLGIEEKSEPANELRVFILRSQRIVHSDQGDLMGTQTAHEVWAATPPGTEHRTADDPFRGRERPFYTAEQLDEIHSSYEDELLGNTRRGSQILHWEDVTEGEHLKPLIRGPLDVLDIVSWNVGSGNPNMAFAWKWNAMRNNLDRCIVDPDTGVPHCVVNWHYQDSIAQAAGLPYAHSNVKQDEAIVATIVSNWMGDDGFLKRLYCTHKLVWFIGETVAVKGRVNRKYIKDSEHLVDLDVWTELPGGQKCCVGEATVKLRSKMR